MEKLKDCPFCGGKAILKDYDNARWMIGCSNYCGVIMTASAKKAVTSSKVHAEIKVNVILNWNKRVK